MIHLCNNIFVTYAQTKQQHFQTDSIIVSKERISHIETPESKVLKQVTSLDLLFENSIEFFDSLIDRINSGESHKIIMYLDDTSFKEFIIKWIVSAFRNANLSELEEIVGVYYKHERDRSGGLRFESNGEDILFDSFSSSYWDIKSEEIKKVYEDKTYYDFNKVLTHRGYEHLIGNAILGDQGSYEELKSKMPKLYKMGLVREFGKVKILFTERIISLANSKEEINDKFVLGVDFYEEITKNDTNRKLLSQYTNKTSIFDNSLTEVIEYVGDLFSSNPKDVPLCTYNIENGESPSVSTMVEDLIGEDKFELLYYYFGENRYSPSWAEFTRSKKNEKNKNSYVAFGPVVL